MTEYFNDTPELMDADHQIHILAFLEDYRGWLTKQWEAGKIGPKSFADRCYLIGNFAGRIAATGITPRVITILEEWEQEYNAAHNN